MQTLFITGAEGFVGTHLMEHLLQQGYEVVAGVRNRARKLALERRFGRALVCEVGDAINVARVMAAVHPDGIVHLAGTSRPQDAVTEPLTAYQSIVTGWANVLDAARRVVPRARILMVSSCDVYGAAGSDGHRLTEDTPPQPESTFGSLKATAETIAQTFHRDYHLNVTVARPFSHIGAGLSEESYFGAVAKRLAQWELLQDGNELQWPDLACRRDVLHVQDVVEAYEKLLCDGRPNEVYNVCSGQTRTCSEIIEMAMGTAGQTLMLSSLEVEDGSGATPVLCGDNGKLCGELGWQPTRNVDQAIKDLVQSFQSALAPTR
ncbi:MAG: GDP-mannose 4,6-dehydratase [Planctomycetes bacterium]|nr:GDP-mannose 4,6-dehydratase [Planctomycetota bacterium]